jgi:hypothetical protein
MNTTAHRDARGLVPTVMAGIAAIATLAALGVAAAVPAEADTGTPAGSIVYVQANNVWIMAPDGSAKTQVTHDGTAADPYSSPSQTDAGTIVALRTYKSDWGQVTVVNRAGQVIRSFVPTQWPQTGHLACPEPYDHYPEGVSRAVVSPDGKHIAYTAWGFTQTPDCQIGQGYESFVSNIDGTGAVRLDGGASREVGTWSNTTQVLLSDHDDFAVGMYRATVGSAWSTSLLQDDDLYGDRAYLEPSLAGSTIAADGWSFAADAPVVRLMNADYGIRCEIDGTSGSDATAAQVQRVSMAPSGTGVVWQESNGTATRTADEGVYAATFTATGCPAAKTLLAAGASAPFWGRAAVHAVDTSAPTVTTTAPPTVTLGTSATFRWSGSDAVSGLANFDVQTTWAGITGSFAAWSTAATATHATTLSKSGLTPGHEYCFRVRARDLAGNVSAFGAPRCTVVPLDDRSLKASTGWTRSTASSAFQHTVTTTTRTGVSLTLANTRAARLAVLATTSTTGGSVAVYAGSTLIGTVSLKATATHAQQVRWLPTVSARTATVTLKTRTSGSVRIDGLVSLRTP